MAVTYCTSNKNRKTEKSPQNFKFQANFLSLLGKLRFSAACSWKKNLVENPEKNERKRPKTGKIGKNDFLIFGKIFQSFRKSYSLVPSHGERKWRRKSRKKNPYGRIFDKQSKKHTKNRNFGGKKDTIGNESPEFPNL